MERINFKLKIPDTLKQVGRCKIHNKPVYQCTGDTRLIPGTNTKECYACNVKEFCRNKMRCGECDVQWLRTHKMYVQRDVFDGG